MLGAIIGDVSGSRFEWDNCKSKDFELFTDDCGPTDDSNMTLAVAQAILRADGHWSKLPELAVASMQEFGRKYPHGYGRRFRDWLRSENPQPYGSWGNGSAMRVSPCAWAASSLEEALQLSDAVTNVTHNHPEGVKGARAITAAVWLARQGATIPEIRKHISENYYPLDFTLDQIREEYEFDVSCQGSVPQAIEAFLESEGFEDAIRNAVSIGGDSDTIAAMAGSIAEAFYGIPPDLNHRVRDFLDETQRGVVSLFEQKYGTAEEKIRNSELTIEQMNRKKKLVKDRLDCAIKQFDNGWSQEVSAAICRELTNAYVYNIDVTVPMAFQGVQMCFAMYRMDEFRFAYIAQTDLKKESIRFGDTVVSMPWRNIIRHAASKAEYEGLVINPDHTDPRGAVFYLNRNLLQRIVQYAEEQISELPESVREEIQKSETSLEKMRGEQKSMSDFLNYAVRLYEKGASLEATAALYKAMIDAYVYNLTASVPMQNFKYAVCRLDDTHYAYVAQTISEDAWKPLGEAIAFMRWPAVIRQAAGDTDCSGLIIDPERKTPQGSNLFLNRDILQQIIRNAEKEISGLPEHIRDEVKKGI